MTNPSDGDVLARWIDAAEQLADLVGGVVGLNAGSLGGDGGRASKPGARRWTNLLVPRFGHKDLVKGMASAWGPLQLDKAADVASGLSTELQPARTSSSAVLLSVVAELDRLGFESFPETLRTCSVRSPELATLMNQLHAGLSAMAAARTRLYLDRRRNASS